MEKEIRPDRVAIYIRWSTEDQGDGTTLAVQSEACRHYLLSQGWQVREDLIFIDDGYSGGSLERPALGRLRQEAKNGEIDCVVVFRLDRLSRSVIDTVMLVLQEWDGLTHVKSAREPVDTTTAMGRQFFYMLVSYAEWERNVIRERMFSGKLRRAREGRSPGMPAPYGYRKGPTPGSLTPLEEEAAAVRQAFRLAEAGAAHREIARALTACGFPTRKGGPWSTSLVSKLLRNPIYSGLLVWGRRRVNPRWGKAPGERKYRAAEPHVVAPGTSLPPLVAQAQFERVQAALSRKRQVPPAAAGSVHLLSGLLRCGRCQGPMQYNRYRHWAYYRCTCKAPAVPAALVEDAVAREVTARYGATALAEALATLTQHRRDEAEKAAAAGAALAGARRRLEAQAHRIDRDYREGRLSAAERAELLAAVRAEAAQLQPPTLAVTVAPPVEPRDPWTALTPREQKEILGHLLDAVQAARAGRDTVEITLTWAGAPPAQSAPVSWDVHTESSKPSGAAPDRPG
ncbi:MAG TPA: recombinase family protein [Symbiobacteriaceae bacterium]|nr:recombinase family protein [Symbiobacteriaceae bacterium]